MTVGDNEVSGIVLVRTKQQRILLYKFAPELCDAALRQVARDLE